MKLVHVVSQKNKLTKAPITRNNPSKSDCHRSCMPIRSGLDFVSNIGNPKEILIYYVYTTNTYLIGISYQT